MTLNLKCSKCKVCRGYSLKALNMKHTDIFMFEQKYIHRHSTHSIATSWASGNDSFVILVLVISDFLQHQCHTDLQNFDESSNITTDW